MKTKQMRYRCPKCGQVTKMKPRQYIDGEVVYFHRKERGIITKHCTMWEQPPLPEFT